jgi:hypothetical protein
MLTKERVEKDVCRFLKTGFFATFFFRLKLMEKSSGRGFSVPTC